jgi:ribosomal-protein-alanine N-acetyltransferase
MSGEITLKALEGRAALEIVDALMELSAELAEAPHWSREVWNSTLEAGRGVLVAEVKAGLAGFVLYSVVAGEAEIESIAVRESLQRQGVGGKLILEALNRLRAGNVACVRLELRASNQKALRFYQAHGFQEVGRRAAYYADPVEDAVLMNLKLVEK